MLLLIFSAILICSLGYLAQNTGLCLVRGVAEATSGKPLFLLAILFSGVMSWVSVLIGYSLDLAIPFISYELSIWAIVGGLLFGLGAAFNNGCGVSTISRLARGHLAMLVTICGWLVGWIILTYTMPSVDAKRYIIDPYWHYSALAILSMFTLIFTVRLSKENRKIWLGMLMIGLMASIVFLTEPHWTPSALLKDMSAYLWSGDDSRWPTTSRFVLICALVGGMFIAALRANTFSLLPVSLWDAAKHLAAGVLMGIGAAIASGGNDSQLLLALPSFSPAGFTTIFFMLVGIALGRRLA